MNKPFLTNIGIFSTAKLLFFLMFLVFSGSALGIGNSWWQFRGPQGNGHSESINLPLHWSEEKNVKWKTKIHDRGWSSPVIWGKQIWITTATVDGHKLFAICLNKDTGQIIYDLHLFDVDKPVAITKDNTYATPTPVVDEGLVIVHYGTYGTACVDTANGKVLWKRRDLNCDHEVGAGPASSPTLVGDRVILHVDGRDVQYIIALDKVTGRTVWKTNRSLNYREFPVHHRKAYCMPILAPRKEGNQLISPAGRGLYAYDSISGRELWHVRHRGWSVAPRPVFGHDLVFATIDRDRPELWAIRLDGVGDVTDTHIAWKSTRGMPQRSSPLLVRDFLFVVNRGGIATCLNAKTGEVLWKERLKGSYSASPIYANKRIYIFNETGLCTIIRPNPKFVMITTNTLAKQTFMATPAVDGNAFVIRSESYIYRIEAISKAIKQ